MISSLGVLLSGNAQEKACDVERAISTAQYFFNFSSLLVSLANVLTE